MRTVLMVNHHTEIVGGGELSMLQLMDGLKAIGESVSLITSGPGELAERAGENGHTVHMVPMPPIGPGSIRALGKWHKKLQEIGGEVLHAQTPRAAFYAGLAGRRASVASIFHCRVAARDRKLDPILVRLVSRVVCNSRATSERFESWPWLKPLVIYNGLDVEVMPLLPDRGETRKTNLLFVGRLSEEKQPDVAWEVFSGLAEEFPELNLVFVGSDDLLNPSVAANLRKRVAHSPLKERVVWAGARQHVSPWYAMAELVIMPSKYEGFGRVLVEAMAHRLPVVAFRVGGIPEVIENGRQGILIEPYDIDAMREAVRELLQDDVKRRQMGEAGPDRARKFSLSSHIEAVIRLYRSLAGDGRGD
ncbi:MAG: glycosyltransferase family 4 protein [Mariprofundaceae bacterium]|nr:glycosyltransferase family 4 protein [Mariprofundaceae bacterium]